MPKIRVGLQIEDTSPSVRHLIGSGKGVSEWDGVDPDEIVKVTYLSGSADIQEINPGIYYNIPSITTAKQGDTLFSDDGRLFVYDEAGSRWFLWYTFDNSSVKIHSNNTITGEGTLDNPLSVNTTLFSLKGDVNPLLKGVDNGDGTFTFTSVDGNTMFNVDVGGRFVSHIGELRSTAGKYDGERIDVIGYYLDTPGVGGGDFYWDKDSIEPDNGGTIIQPNSALLPIGTCYVTLNGTDSSKLVGSGNAGELAFPVKLKFSVDGDNDFYLIGRSGWAPSDYGASSFGLKWGIRYSNGNLYFSINDPSEGIFSISSPQTFNNNQIYEVEIVDDLGDTVLYLDSVELGRITTWNRTTMTTHSSIELGVGGNNQGSIRGLKGNIYSFQFGAEIWDLSQHCGETVLTGSNGDITVNNSVWNILYEGRWKRFFYGSYNAKDFGAKGDGVTNDTDSFINVSEQIEKDNGGKLIIPFGTYIVGEQVIGTAPYYQPKKIISITGCTNPVTIIGNGATLKAADGLHYGAFDPVTGAVYNSPSFPFTDYDYNCGTYTGMVVLNSNTLVKVSSLNLDGNNDQYVFGGGWGPVSWGHQIRSTGLYLSGNKHTLIENINSSYHGLDGIIITDQNATESSPQTPAFLTNVKCTYNGRQGLTISGGKGIIVSNSEFSHTGKGANHSGPGAGCDIEPNSGVYVRDIFFIGCNFINNAGRALLADSGNSKNIKLKYCTFVGTTNAALWPEKPGIVFEDCVIVGKVQRCQQGEKGVATEFHRCLFTDDVAYSPTGLVDYSGHLIDVDSGVLFDNCTIEVRRGSLGNFEGSVIRNCLFKLHTGTEYLNNRGIALSLGGTTIENITVIEDITGTPPADRFYIYTPVTMVSYGYNYLDSPNDYLYWNSWSPAANGFKGQFGDSKQIIYDRLILSRTGLRNNAQGNRSIRYSTAEPTSENYSQGDIVFNSSGTSPVGWRCIVSGSTGNNAVFEPFGSALPLHPDSALEIDNSLISDVDTVGNAFQFVNSAVANTPSEANGYYLLSGGKISSSPNFKAQLLLGTNTDAMYYRSTINGTYGAWNHMASRGWVLTQIPNSLGDLSGSSDDISEGSINLFNVNADWNAGSGGAEILNKPILGTAAAADTGDFATAAQGTLAGTAIQPGDDITELNNNGVYLNEASHDALPADNPHSVNIQQTYDEGSPASTSTPDNVLTTEAGVVKTTPILNYNVFNQNIRNSVNVVGTTETTILNPTTGSLSLTTNDCAANNSYELEITGELTWGGTTTGVDVILYIGTQTETISIPLSGTGTEPIKIEAKLDFLDGVDTARTCVFTGNVIHIDSTGTTVYIPISETELTVDVSSGTTFDATFTGTDAIDEITVSKAMLNRVVS